VSRDAITRIGELTASLRRCLAAVAPTESSWVANTAETDLARIATDVEALADDVMVAALSKALVRRCHCGAPIEARDASGRLREGEPPETCGSGHCRGVAREAYRTIQRYERGPAARGAR
jgi:hypothetical protein